MLTTEAFNALLKTLEEPPSHSLFILCTTELHKVPETIISRCVQIKFTKATTDELTRSLLRMTLLKVINRLNRRPFHHWKAMKLSHWRCVQANLQILSIERRYQFRAILRILSAEALRINSTDERTSEDSLNIIPDVVSPAFDITGIEYPNVLWYGQSVFSILTF